MWRLRYRDLLTPGVWILHWCRTKEEAEKWAEDSDIEHYEVRHVQWPPMQSWDGGTQEQDELTNAIAFMNRWAQHILQ